MDPDMPQANSCRTGGTVLTIGVLLFFLSLFYYNTYLLLFMFSYLCLRVCVCVIVYVLLYCFVRVYTELLGITRN